ncbi:UDP-glucose 4-epimerase GalE [candidate division KSB1 bacterium]|nr:MAG: UDP-glucose 4-epimerase GalE [candidate division KSB1 bacterium]
MAILVTGAAGYIGSIVTEELLNQGHSVIAIDNLQEGNREAVLPGAVFYEGNIGDEKLLTKIFKNHRIDAVLHFAAETTIEFSMTNPKIYFENNVVNGIRLLNVMLEHKCNRFIFSSTAATFGEPQYTPIDEKHPQLPINAYGESKLMFEHILDWYHKAYGLKFNAFRYFNAAGASEKLGEAHRHESHLIPLVLKRALAEQKSKKAEQQRKKQIENREDKNKEQENISLKVFGNDYPTKDGTCVRDYIHVVDLAQAHILALENLNCHPDGKYNLGNGKGFTVLEVIETAKKVTGVDIPYEIAGRRPGDPAVLIASSELAQRELGWESRFRDLESIIGSAWKWHSAHPKGYER